VAAAIHLDTSFLILALAPARNEGRQLASWIESGRDVRVSAIAWAGFVCGPVGPEALEAAARVTGRPVPFDGVDGLLAGRLFNIGGRRSRSLPDCMIAATAINADAVLATANPKDFERFAPLGLVVAS
jgi:predicted nucleic acid-binding protein